MKPSSLFWWRWLVIAAFLVLAFGASLVVLPGPTQQVFNLLFFSSGRVNPASSANAAAYISFVCAVLGAVMIGWSTALILILFGPFRRGLREGWSMVTVSLAGWFIPDTAISLIYGFWQNAVLNLVIAILFAIPLTATYKTCHAARV